MMVLLTHIILIPTPPSASSLIVHTLLGLEKNQIDIKNITRDMKENREYS